MLSGRPIATSQLRRGIHFLKPSINRKFFNHLKLKVDRDKCFVVNNENATNFRLVLNVVCFLLGNSLASEFYMPTFRNTLFRLHRRIGMKIEQTDCSETSAYKI